MSSVLRGIRKSDWKKVHGPSHHAFLPDKHTIASRRERNASPHAEASMNWEDDDGALAQLSAEPSAQHGVVRIADFEGVVDFANARLPGHFTSERAPLLGNQYHGNFLYAAEKEAEWVRVAMLLSAAAEYAE